MSRRGILAGGNFIVDHIKLIDCYPHQNMLATISSSTTSNGGGPYNVLKDLSALGAEFPLQAIGLIGDDINGRWILKDCARVGIDTSRLRLLPRNSTSYTDAMTVKTTGRRTFFHHRGANAELQADHFDFMATETRIFYLGYLMVLDGLDILNGKRTGASYVLEAAQSAGLTTVVDCVSLDHPEFSEICQSSLPYTDHLIVNEIEAGKIARRPLQGSEANIADVINIAKQLHDQHNLTSIAIHFETGAIALSRGENLVIQGSLELPQGRIMGATGAGDAFAAGYLFGIHENWSTPERVRLGIAAAAACLADPTASAGVQSVSECLELADQYPQRVLQSGSGLNASANMD